MHMKKLQYIQPVCDVTVIKTSYLMGDPLLGSGTGPEPAPKRRGEVIE